MRIALPVLLAVTLLAGTALGEPPKPTGWPQGYEPLDRIRAIVDDEVITEYELERAFVPLSGLGHSILDEGEREKWFAEKRKEALEELINTLLLLSEARKMDLDVPPQRVAEHMQQLRAQNQLATDADLEKFVQMQGFRNKEHYQEHVEREMLRTDAVRYKIASRIRPSSDDVQRVFLRDYHGGKGQTEIHAQHIMIKVPQLVTPRQIREISEKIHRIRDMALTEQKTFEALAREFSEDLNGPHGGDLGWFSRCVLEPMFEREAFGLKVGEISKVVQTSKGYHVIRVLDRRTAPLGDVKTIQSCIRRDLEIENAEQAYGALAKELRVYHHVKELP